MPSYYTASMPNSPGIYRITCTATAKIYIGSALSLRKRRKDHFGLLQLKRHKNPKLQNAWNKYGPDAFTFEILELVLIPELLTAREQYWIDTLHPFFNIAPIAGSHLGMKRSPEARKNIGDSRRGKPSPLIGYKQPSEVVERRRIASLGRKQTEEHKRKAAQTRIGKQRSPQTREKMRQSALGHAPTNARKFILTSPDGTEYLVENGLPSFCKEHGLNRGVLVQVARGKRKHHKGWKARYAS